MGQPELGHHLARARMHGEDDREAGSDPVEFRHDCGQGFPVVDVGGPVERHVDELARPDVQGGENPARPRHGEIGAERINHDVSHQLDPRRRHALAAEVLVGIGRWRQQQVGNGVGGQAVYLLRHRAVKAAETRLDVGDADPQFGADQRARHGGVDVPHDDHPVGFLLQAGLLKPDHDIGRLARVRTRADPEVDVRRRDPQFLEKNVRHQRVIVLPGVHETEFHRRRGRRLALVEGRDRLDERGHLHEIGPGAGDDQQLRSFGHDFCPRTDDWLRPGTRD